MEQRAFAVQDQPRPKRPLFLLGDTALTEPRQRWRGRKVLDRYDRQLGVVKDVLVEHRSLDEVLSQDIDGRAWGVRATYAVVRMGTGWRSHFGARTVLIPVSRLEEDGDALRTDQDLIDIQLMLSA